MTCERGQNAKLEKLLLDKGGDCEAACVLLTTLLSDNLEKGDHIDHLCLVPSE